MSAARPKRKQTALIGFYWRKMIFFGVFFTFLGFAISNTGTFRADVDSYTPPSNQSSELPISIQIEKNGNILVDGQKIKTRINSSEKNDEMILPIIENSGSNYSSVIATVVLPEEVADSSQFEIKGIHGVGPMEVLATDGRTLVYRASDVGPVAEVSLILKMPEGTINQPFVYQVYNNIAKIKSAAWLIIAIWLPIITFTLMVGFILMLQRNERVDQPDVESDMPPMHLPPAVVGVLYNQKVGPREIAATLIDLAMRGDIYILDRERDFAFAKNRYDQRLLSYEKILLSKIFSQNVVSDREEIERRINNHLYSRKMSLVTSGIYIIATRLGYFRANPQKVFRKYQLWSMLAFFVGLGGFILSLKIFTNPPYVAFFWVGMMISAITISLVARQIPIRTPQGRENLSNWLAFRKYLTNPAPIAFSYENFEIFQKYLPYAIVLDCEVAWAKRFSEHNFILPEWFVSDRSNLSLQDFCLSLFPLVSYVARSLAAIKEPGFE